MRRYAAPYFSKDNIRGLKARYTAEPRHRIAGIIQAHAGNQLVDVLRSASSGTL
jgi:hypothetical protein